MVQAPVLTPTRGEAPPRRLLVLASKSAGLSPGQRFRLEQWAPRLERDHGIRLDLAPFESPELTNILYERGHLLRKALLVLRDFARRRKILHQAHRYDAVVVFREAALIGPAIYERLLSARGNPLIYDFDDSIWSPAQEMGNGPFSRLHFFGKTSTICRLAAAITPGNEFLASYARQFNDRVFVVPTSIELEDYPVIPEPDSAEPFVICWTGSTSTLAHFEFAREALQEVARRIPVAVKVICNRPPDLPIRGAEMRFVPWRRENEAQEIGDCHVGIMPLPDNEVTRGKCALKALQCMATGRPVVVSPVGVNKDIIRSGENGILAGTTAETVEALLRLAADRDLRVRMGSAARRTVERTYSAEVAAARFADVVRFVTDSPALRPRATQ